MKFVAVNRLAACTLAVSMMMSASAFAANLGVISGIDVNIRTDSEMEASVIRKGDNNEVFTVTAAKNSFYKINGNNVTDGFVNFDFFKIISADAQVKGNDVNIRKGPSISSDVITKLNLGDSITIVGQTDEWYALKYNDSIAYINKEFAVGTFINKVPPISEIVSEIPAQTKNNSKIADENISEINDNSPIIENITEETGHVDL